MSARERMTRAEDYVFGVMDERERARAERDMEVDPEFRACVTQLAERLRQLHQAKGSAPLSDADWKRVTDRISDLPQMGGKDDSAQLKELGFTLPDPAQKGLLRIKRPGAQQFAGWRGTVVAMALVAAIVIGYYAGQGMAPVPSPVAVVLLQGENSGPDAILEIYRNHSIRLLPLAETTVPPGHVLQLWTWQNGTQIPLAVLGSAAEITLTGPELAAPQAGQAYALTLEPATDKAIVEPTGETLLSGTAILPPR